MKIPFQKHNTLKNETLLEKKLVFEHSELSIIMVYIYCISL